MRSFSLELAMKRNIFVKGFFLFIFLGFTPVISAQADKLPNSIGYKNQKGNSSRGRKVDHTNITRKKVDLKDQNLLYIEIDPSDTYGNTGLFGPNAEKINSSLLRKMDKKYPYRFDAYPNNFKYKGTEFFIKEGYNYRLVIVSTFQDVNSFETNVTKQFFAVGIEDLHTGRIYITTNYTGHPLYVKKFVKSLKE